MTKLTLPITKASRRAKSNSCLAGRHPKKRPCFCDKYFLSFSQINLSREELRQKKSSNFAKLRFLNDSYTKKAIWHLAIWQNWCFVQFYQSRIEFLKNCSVFFVLVPLVREKFERSKENIKHKKSGPREKLP